MFLRFFYLFLPFLAIIGSQRLWSQNLLDMPRPDASLSFENAEAFFSACLYEKAIPLYEKCLSEQQHAPAFGFVNLRLGQSYFFSQQYEKSLYHFENIPSDFGCKAQPFFIGLAKTRLGLFLAAVESFENYLKSSEKKLKNEAHFELGLAHFHLGNQQAAAENFSLIPYQASCLRLYLLSRFYLARIALLQNNFLAAEEWLNQAAPYLESSGLLEHEWAYLNGELYFLWKDYQKAADWYEIALPKRALNSACWYSETLFKLGTAHLKIAENSLTPFHCIKDHLEKAESAFNTLAAISSDEKTYIALAQCLSIKARLLNDTGAYAIAEKKLSFPPSPLSREMQSQLLLLRAQASPSYVSRDQLYRQLTQEIHHESPAYAKGWLLRGLNDFEEAQLLLEQNQRDEAVILFERAIATLHKAFTLLRSVDSVHAALALKYQAYSFYLLDGFKDKSAAFELLNYLMNSPDLFDKISDPDEIFYLQGQIAFRLGQIEENFKENALAILKRGITAHPNGKFADKILYLLGTISYQAKDYSTAEEAFSLLISHYLDSPLKAEALYWKSNAIEKIRPDSVEFLNIKKQIYEQYPDSLYAPEAYFTLFSYRDYLQGDRISIKHLHGFLEKFPDSPLLLNVYYLLGMDCKMDRKSPEGKWISKKNLISAIDAFQQCELAFDRLYEKGCLPLEKMPHYTAIRYRATLERALTNLAIAEASQGAKQKIYLEYAEGVLREINSDFSNVSNSWARFLNQETPYSPYEEESSYWLAQCHLKQGNSEEAIRTFHQMLEKYQSAGITRGYFLSKVCYNLGMAAMGQRDFSNALIHFSSAEDAAKGKILSIDEKLDLWIQKSLCYQRLNQLDDAILLLSKVINDDAISGLRIKAMYLRAAAYELQGRHELARKQLEATSKKGGEWGLKAKQKLDQEYGYQ